MAVLRPGPYLNLFDKLQMSNGHPETAFQY